jgi:2-polyprenyl-3-methyl-5-hydroxy-6-metoxy-1,4-benzoquinol methylase
LILQDQYPLTAHIVETLAAAWPEHSRFLEQSFATRDVALMKLTERRSAVIMKIVGDDDRLDQYCRDYIFLCGRLMEEEIFFRRHDHYRLSNFEDALSEVYSNREFMARYMNFLLLSHVLWDNHARAMTHFEQTYLPALPQGTDHLEVGPGHGLLLHLAAATPGIASATGWDVSQASIDQARSCLKAMGTGDDVQLTLQDLFDANRGADGKRYGSVVLAEVLEHLEDPLAALRAMALHMRPGALLWIHVPINSPAPDHIYLLRTPEEAVALVREAGFEVLDSAFYPMTGQTLERARKHNLTISAVITAKLPLEA